MNTTSDVRGKELATHYDRQMETMARLMESGVSDLWRLVRVTLVCENNNDNAKNKPAKKCIHK